MTRIGPYGPRSTWSLWPPLLVRPPSPIEEANLRDARRRVAAAESGALASAPPAADPARGRALGPLQPAGAIVSDAVAQRRKQASHDSRQRCIEILAVVAAKYLSSSPAVQRIIREEGELTASSPSLIAVTAVKSDSTLLRRACSLRLYRAWFETSGFVQDSFFTESAAYKYYKFLYDDRAPATRAAGMHQAFLFVGGLFEIPLDVFLRSSRLRGLTVMNLRTRAEVRQSAPLKVRMVLALEACVVKDGGRGSPRALLAGASLFTLYARARVGDMARCTVEPQLDIVGKKGYAETRFELHKTARPGSRALLPITANAFGLLHEPWAAYWLKARAAAGLSAEKQGTLLPAAAETGWHDLAMKTTEFAAQLRSLLIELGFAIADLERVGAHSLKSTCLAWAAKFGVAKEQRRLLGYHLAPGDRTLEAYSRDSMASPLRCLDEVLAAIASKEFDPDATRSGAFAAPAARDSPESALSVTGAGAVSPTKSEEFVVVDDSGAAAASTAHDQDASERQQQPQQQQQQQQQGIDDVSVHDGEVSSASSTLSSASPVASSDDDEVPADPGVDGDIILNTFSQRYHLDAGEGRLRDGKAYPRYFVRMSAVPPGGSLCTRCF